MRNEAVLTLPATLLTALVATFLSIKEFSETFWKITSGTYTVDSKLPDGTIFVKDFEVHVPLWAVYTIVSLAVVLSYLVCRSIRLNHYIKSAIIFSIVTTLIFHILSGIEWTFFVGYIHDRELMERVAHPGLDDRLITSLKRLPVSILIGLTFGVIVTKGVGLVVSIPAAFVFSWLRARGQIAVANR